MESSGIDRLDQLLESYDRRKQDETRALVERARRLESNRQKGADLLRRHVVPTVRDAVRRIGEAGHQVTLDEMLDAYPPNVRIHLWVKPGPLDPPEGERPRTSLEFVWGDPNEDRMCVNRWTSGGLGTMGCQAAAREGVVDMTWVKEQLHVFVREALSG
ncbi:MAG: hypothetical protein PVI57_16590 [Gemmatimonadota bacterium]